MKTTVIFHNADYDGIFCREIARKFLPDAELIGWNFGDPPIKVPSLTSDGTIYVLDLPVDEPFGFSYRISPKQPFVDPKKFIWIDHHKSSIDSHPKDIPGYRIDGVAACRLAWHYFTCFAGGWTTADVMARKEDFVDRNVAEPLAVRLAGEYDIWDKRDPDAETFQFGLRSRDLTEDDWHQMLSILRPKVADIERLMDAGHAKNLLEPDGTARPPIVWELLDHGRVIQRYAQKTDADLVTHKSYRIKWEGLDFLVLNTGRFNSLTFAALDKPETGHDALLGYMFNGKCWTVSMYHASHRKDIDLSAIAVKHGGGGHKGACGFTCSSLPFLQTPS